MLTRNLLLRIIGPALFVSFLSLASCVSAAVYLHHRQSASLRILDQSLWSHRLAADLLRTIEALSAGDEDSMGRIGGLIEQARRHADKPGEAQLANLLDEAFAQYQRERQAGSGEPPGLDDGARIGAKLAPICHELEKLSTAEVERAEAALQQAVAWTAWGLVGMGLLGASAGVLSGHAAARGLGRDMLRAEELAEVGQIAAGLAHELRNPLTSIKMLVQVDRERAEARSLPSDDLYAIEQEIRRMEGRLNAFMDFARPPRPERRLLDLTPIVDQTIALIGGRAGKQRVELRFDRPAEPVMLEADGEQIRQVLVNLTLNALDVMPRGGSLAIQLEPPHDGQVEIRVLDTGPGIPERHLPRLYEPFFTSKDTGLGLGLVVSQRIARDHGGRLTARNRPEGGACFVLRLPAPKTH